MLDQVIKRIIMKFRRIFSLRIYFDSLKAVGKYPRLIKVFNLQRTYEQSLTKTTRFPA